MSKHQHRSNEIVSSILHMLGVAMAIVILVLLVVFASKAGDAERIVAYAIYGGCMIILYAASATYHMIPYRMTRAREVARRIDHAAIYIFIAATYTPFTFLALPASWGWSLFGIVWGCALFGAAATIARWPVPKFIMVLLYVVMGWLILLAYGPLVSVVRGAAFWLLLSGGIAYTAGIIFYLLDKFLRQRPHFWMHEIFHLFVLAGSILHIIVMFMLFKLV